MARRNSFEVVEDIKEILGKERELSVKAISTKIKAQWETTIKALEFMKSQGMVSERKGKKTNKVERLFSLKR